MKKNLRDLLIDELHDILSSEEQIVKALPAMVKASECAELKKAFEGHLKETKGQILRLKAIFRLLKVEKKEKFCKATKGLIDECKEVLKDFKTKSPLKDAAMISKAQRIEHYEISAYGTARTFAKEMDLDEVADLLQATLDEEGNADKKLSKIAEGGLLTYGVNQQAMEATAARTKAVPRKTASHARTATTARTRVTARAHSTVARKTKKASTAKSKR